MSIKLRRQEECEQVQTATKKMKHCLTFSHEIFYVTIVLSLGIIWLKAVDEITARQTQTSFAKFSKKRNYSIEYVTSQSHWSSYDPPWAARMWQAVRSEEFPQFCLRCCNTDCLHVVQLMPLHPKTPSSLDSFKFRLVLPFWYRLTQVVLENRPLNGCSSSSSKWRVTHQGAGSSDPGSMHL